MHGERKYRRRDGFEKQSGGGGPFARLRTSDLPDHGAEVVERQTRWP